MHALHLSNCALFSRVQRGHDQGFLGASGLLATCRISYHYHTKKRREKRREERRRERRRREERRPYRREERRGEEKRGEERRGEERTTVLFSMDN